MKSDQAKARLFCRLEKILITMESILVGAFVGICVGLYFGFAAHTWKVGIIFGLVFSVGICLYKRFAISSERKIKK